MSSTYFRGVEPLGLLGTCQNRDDFGILQFPHDFFYYMDLDLPSFHDHSSPSNDISDFKAASFAGCPRTYSLYVLMKQTGPENEATSCIHQASASAVRTL